MDSKASCLLFQKDTDSPPSSSDSEAFLSDSRVLSPDSGSLSNYTFFFPWVLVRWIPKRPVYSSQKTPTLKPHHLTLKLFCLTLECYRLTLDLYLTIPSCCFEYLWDGFQSVLPTLPKRHRLWSLIIWLWSFFCLTLEFYLLTLDLYLTIPSFFLEYLWDRF